MAIKVSQGFQRTSANPIDESIALTKAQMLLVNDNLMPNKYFTICQDDGFLYLYDKSATPNEQTGKFTKFEGGSGEQIQFETLPTPSASLSGVILQFIGATDTYTNGYFYKCTEDNGSYSWVQHDVQPSGGGGTTDYSDLNNKPSINDVTLSGNKTTSDLNISYSDLKNKPSIPSITNCYQTSDTAFTDLADADYVPVYDSSASAKKKSTWSNIKSVLKTYFDSLYFKELGAGLEKSSNTLKVKEFAEGDMDDVIGELPQGNTLVGIAQAFNKGDIYSTSEKMIGQWIDGKPLYQKTINFGSLPSSATTKNVAHGISNLERVVARKISAKDTDGYFYDFDYLGGVTANVSGSTATIANGISMWIGATNISIITGRDRSSLNAYITLQYTKSTDSSVSIGEDTEYSTSEKIVGTWIDGSKLYQKTINLGNMPNNTEKSVSLGISNLSKVVDIKGYVTDGSNVFSPLPYVNNLTSSGNADISVRVSSGSIYIQTFYNLSSWSGYATIQYTKTTG